ncbi:MAG: siphovirus Gp157 family protein [Pseudomonadota bacterium]|nr:siphovirus Gp157 family protein [Pseudomonadota bacterium]
MITLYEISTNFLDAMNFLSDPDNEIDNQTIADTMESLTGEFTDKALNVARYIASIEAEAQAIKEVEKRQEQRRKSLENSAIRLREYLKSQMVATGNDKIKSSDIALSLAKLPPSVQIEDEALIPSKYWRVVESKSIDKTAIKSANGCPGARIESNGYRVSIK